jgi:hypothetical protein
MRAQVDFVLEQRLGNGRHSEHTYHQYQKPVDEVHARNLAARASTSALQAQPEA